MNKSLIAVFCFLFLLGQSISASELSDYWVQHSDDSEISVDHTQWNQLLTTYIEEKDGLNLFRYGAFIPADKERLNQYLIFLQSVVVTNLNADEQFAYWINLYNALTIKVILDHYPVASIQDISYGLLSFGPWKEQLVTVEGFELSLDDIEHEILRPIFRDNRIHYAVNCASVGCPNLQITAFTADNLDDLLEFAATQYINHPRGVTIIEDELIVSSIYDWYAEDFGDDDEEIVDHLLEYAEAGLAAGLSEFDEIEDYEYDWSLNE